MFGIKSGSENRSLPLKPFLLKIKDGFLLGVAMDPQEGSPCADCYARWLSVRNVWNEKADLSELRCRRDLVASLIGENNPHIAYEIGLDGNAIRLENIVFPHPECQCATRNYIAARQPTKGANYAISPIYQIKCARYGTPDGNSWLTSATGEAPLSRALIQASGVGVDKEECRQRAVEEWLKQAALADAKFRMANGGAIDGIHLLTGVCEKKANLLPEEWQHYSVGAGDSRELAVVDALLNYARTETLAQYSTALKNPMLIVGANNWIRTRVPFFLLQQYDLHLLFYPNAMQAWVVGVAAFSRLHSDEEPQFVFAADTEMGKALTKALGQVLSLCQPGEWTERRSAAPERTAQESEKTKKLNMWWTHWIYRCPKISLKDVIHMEPYAKNTKEWKNFFLDGQTPVSILELNTGSLPSGIRHMVAIRVHKVKPATAHRGNVIGIGTWKASRAQAARDNP